MGFNSENGEWQRKVRAVSVRIFGATPKQGRDWLRNGAVRQHNDRKPTICLQQQNTLPTCQRYFVVWHWFAALCIRYKHIRKEKAV